MKRIRLLIPFVLFAAILSSCGGTPLEDLTISLILGVDLDDEKNIVVFESSPVFNKDAQKNMETHQTKAKSIRESRKYFDSMTMGKVTSAKIQVLLIGKRVIEHEDWFMILDTMYRNPAFSTNSRMIIVDGPVSDVIFYQAEDKPQLALFLKRMIDENVDRTRTVISTLQVLHRQMYEKGMTASVPEIKKENNVQLIGASLLDEKGKYMDKLSTQDTSLLLVLKNGKKKQLTFSIPIPSLGIEEGIFRKNEVSMEVAKAKTKIKTKYINDQFHFNYKIYLSVNIIEQLFPVDMVSESELEKMIEKELIARFEEVISKIQKNKIDPIGLGLHARAFQYEHYKKVEDSWGDALAESIINVSLDVDIKSMGSVR